MMIQCIVCNKPFADESYTKYLHKEHEMDPGQWLPSYYRFVYNPDKIVLHFCGCQCGTDWYQNPDNKEERGLWKPSSLKS